MLPPYIFGAIDASEPVEGPAKAVMLVNLRRRESIQDKSQIPAERLEPWKAVHLNTTERAATLVFLCCTVWRCDISDDVERIENWKGLVASCETEDWRNDWFKKLYT